MLLWAAMLICHYTVMTLWLRRLSWLSKQVYIFFAFPSQWLLVLFECTICKRNSFSWKRNKYRVRANVSVFKEIMISCLMKANRAFNPNTITTMWKESKPILVNTTNGVAWSYNSTTKLSYLYYTALFLKHFALKWEATFARFNIPKGLMSDNEPSYMSTEFQGTGKITELSYAISSPYKPLK